MIFREKPSDWNPKFEVVGAYVEHEGKLLLLQRAITSHDESFRWGAPGGKVDPGENKLSTVIREVKEETGLEIKNNQITFCGTTFIRYPNFDYVFHMHHVLLDGDRPSIIHNPREHNTSDFKSLNDSLSLPLMMDEPDSIRLMYQFLKKNNIKSNFCMSPENFIFNQEL